MIFLSNNSLVEVISNQIVLSVILTWLFAGVIKFIISFWQEDSFSFFNELMRTGGMPSAHSAVVATLCLSIFYLEGFSTLFFAATVFSFIIIRDSFGVRWSVGEQAKIINQLIKHDQLQTKVKVVLGHTVFQSIMGIILGLAVASLIHIIRLKTIIPA